MTSDSSLSHPSLARAAADALDKTLHDLEWSRVVHAIASRCSGPLHDELRVLPLASDVEQARVWMEETREALALRRDGDPLPLSGLYAVRPSLLRVEKKGVLDGLSLRHLASTLGAARVLRSFLGRRKERCPRLYAACPLDPSLDGLEEEISSCIEEGGTIADHASPELRRLRTEVANLRARIVARLEQMLIEHEAVVQDRFLTVREGRYVIPVRTDAHDKIPGIVHGTSSSGATAFVEPRAMVEQQNRLTLAMSEMEQEEARILAQLSDLVGERLPSLWAAVDALDRADLRSASARLAEDTRAHAPEIVGTPRVKLARARHLLLVLDGVKVVENDLELAAGHALVLSGPNAGGKTVSLKLFGLAALMARTGLCVPAQEGAEVGFFEPIVSDVGDEQSIEKNLSTFSAHVVRLAAILQAAGPSALVLLDEVATGTDPGEGAALACAVVDSLCRRGAAVAVTTHYEPLKAMALEDTRLRNASVGFDVERMAPTFAVRMDVPGASSALAVAQRFGLDSLVIERARAMLPDQSRSFDALVRRLEQKHDEAERERAELERERRAAKDARERIEKELAVLKQREKRKLSEEGERLIALIRETRDEVKAARAAMRQKASDVALVEAARSAVERAAHRANEGELADAIRPSEEAVDERPRVDERGLGVGVRVFVPRLRSEVEIVEGPTRGRVRVAAGHVKLWVDVDEVRAASEPRDGAREGGREQAREARRAEPLPKEPPRPPESYDAPVLRTEDTTLDLRGMRVDDAISMVETFLDRMYGASQRFGVIVHGVGTGALRDAVRTTLKGAPRYVRRFRPGLPEEGGDRVTVVFVA